MCSIQTLSQLTQTQRMMCDNGRFIGRWQILTRDCLHLQFIFVNQQLFHELLSCSCCYLESSRQMNDPGQRKKQIIWNWNCCWRKRKENIKIPIKRFSLTLKPTFPLNREVAESYLEEHWIGGTKNDKTTTSKAGLFQHTKIQPNEFAFSYTPCSKLNVCLCAVF